jgi:hypothetical protein
VRKAGFKISVTSVAYLNPAQRREIEFNLKWRGRPQIVDEPPFLADLISDPHVVTAQWKLP